MNNKTNPNQPAFACASDAGHQEGLTKREYFAAMALQGVLANPDNHSTNLQLAIVSVAMADDLIKALNNEQ